MGAQKKRREAFFRDHPVCCFCGGLAPATEEDHQPARTLFDQRAWPEGYVFPACTRCNSATRKDELLLAMISRIHLGTDEPTPYQEAEAKKCIKAVANNFPGLLKRMRVSANDVRDFFRSRGQRMPAGMVASDVPLITIKDPVIHSAAEKCFGKLLCALHYHHAENVLPKGSHVVFQWFSNVQVADGRLRSDALEFLRTAPRMKRARNDLSDQFDYRFAVAKEKTTTVYLCRFRRSIYCFGYAASEPDTDLDLWAETAKKAVIWKPYAWTA